MTDQFPDPPPAPPVDPNEPLPIHTNPAPNDLDGSQPQSQDPSVDLTAGPEITS